MREFFIFAIPLTRDSFTRRVIVKEESFTNRNVKGVRYQRVISFEGGSERSAVCNKYWSSDDRKRSLAASGVVGGVGARLVVPVEIIAPERANKQTNVPIRS